MLTAIMAGGALAAFALAQRALVHGWEPYRLAAHGLLIGIAAFILVLLAAPLAAPLMFRFGALLIGFATGLFAVGTLTAAMGLESQGKTALAISGHLGSALAGPTTGYGTVYYIEIFLLLAGLVAIGPLCRRSTTPQHLPRPDVLGLAQLPG